MHEKVTRLMAPAHRTRQSGNAVANYRGLPRGKVECNPRFVYIEVIRDFLQ